MAITGKLSFTTGHAGCGTGCWYVLGADGKHYVTVLARSVTLPQIDIGCGETLSSATSISAAAWAAALSGLGFSALGSIGDYSPAQNGIIPAPGTPYFFWLGSRITPSCRISGVRFKRDVGGTSAVDGGILYSTGSTSATFFAPQQSGACIGSNVISGHLYGVTLLGDYSDNARWCLVKLPLAGSSEDVSGDAWAAFIAKLMPRGSYFTDAGTDPRHYFNRCAVLPDPNGVGILTYVSADIVAYGAPGALIGTTGSEYWVVNASSMAVTTTQADARAAFGQPWPDSGTKYDGTPSTVMTDDYSAPTCSSVAGGTKIIFGRSFSDQRQIVRLRIYFKDATTGAITLDSIVEVGVTTPTPSALDMVMAPLETGSSDIIVAVTDSQDWYFETFTPPPTPLPTGRNWVARVGPIYTAG